MDKNERLKERCFWSKGTLCMLELGLGYRTIFFALTPLHLLPVSFHEFMQRKVHLSQSGSTKMDVTVSNVRQSRSNAFALSPVRNVSGLGPPLPSHTALNAIRTHPTTTRMTAPYGRSVAGVLPLIIRIMTAPPLITGAS
jgi:hypothetical protein